MAELLKVEFEIDEKCHGALCSEAQRLGLTEAEVVHRAVAAWLGEIADDVPGAAEETPASS